MKMKSLLFNFIAFLLIGIGVLSFLNTEKSVYTPRKVSTNDATGMQEWLLKRRANPKTGKVDYAYIAKMKKELAKYNVRKTGNEFKLDWIEM
jgi:Tfp pilus assembly protein PilV